MIGDLFTLGLLNPMINLLVILNNVLFNSFGLAIIAFTILIRLATFPLTLRQLNATKSLQALQPKIQEINKKYSDPKRRQEEMMKIYRESGANPLTGCLGPMLLQFPILIALYNAVRIALPNSPEALEKLAGHVYDWSFLQTALPLEEHFIGFDLREPNLIFVILVGATTWAQSKTTVIVSTDERARAQQQMMTIMLPIMFAFFALQFPSGVSLYWVVNSIVGVVFNVLTYGFPALKIEPLLKVRNLPSQSPAEPAASPAAAVTSSRELRTANGPGRSKRQNRRRRP